MELLAILKQEILVWPRRITYIVIVTSIAVTSLLAMLYYLERDRELLIVLLIVLLLTPVDILILWSLLYSTNEAVATRLAQVLQGLGVKSIKVRRIPGGVLVVAILRKGQLHIRAGSKLVEALFIDSPTITLLGKPAKPRLSMQRIPPKLTTSCREDFYEGEISAISLHPIYGEWVAIRGKGRYSYKVCPMAMSLESFEKIIKNVVKS